MLGDCHSLLNTLIAKDAWILIKYALMSLFVLSQIVLIIVLMLQQSERALLNNYHEFWLSHTLQLHNKRYTYKLANKT